LAGFDELQSPFAFVVASGVAVAASILGLRGREARERQNGDGHQGAIPQLSPMLGCEVERLSLSTRRMDGVGVSAEQELQHGFPHLGENGAPDRFFVNRQIRAVRPTWVETRNST